MSYMRGKLERDVHCLATNTVWFEKQS